MNFFAVEPFVVELRRCVLILYFRSCNGDTYVDLTDAVSAVSVTDTSTFAATSNQLDDFTFVLSGGDLIDIA